MQASALAFSSSLTVNARMSLQDGGIFIPQLLVHRTPIHSPTIFVAVLAPTRTSPDDNPWRMPTLYPSKPFICIDLHKFRGVRRGAWKGNEKRAPGRALQGCGCPPGIRTPIERVRVASPTIERGGNRCVFRAALETPPPFRVYEACPRRSTRRSP